MYPNNKANFITAETLIRLVNIIIKYRGFKSYISSLYDCEHF